MRVLCVRVCACVCVCCVYAHKLCVQRGVSYVRSWLIFGCAILTDCHRLDAADLKPQAPGQEDVRLGSLGAAADD